MRPLLFATFLLATGCATRTSVEVLHPADVAVPGHIQKIAVIDRSSPDNVGSTVLGVLEGAITGEGINADPEGRQAALNDLAWLLREGDRFEVITPNVDPKSVDSGLFETQMEWQKAKRFCKKHECDGIIALEAFDSDTDIINLNEGNPLRYDEDNIPVFGARRSTRVMASWRLYDTTNSSIIDESRDRTYARDYNGEGSTLESARSGLPRGVETVKALGSEAGKAYAGRISPTWRWETRTWFSKGSPDLKMAKRHVKAADWEGAAEIWRRGLESADPKERGKSSFNLALYNERKGNLRRALKLAKDGAVAVANGRTRAYVAILERRLRDQERLEQQMREAEEGRRAKEAEEAAAKAKAEASSKTKSGSTEPAGDGRTGGGSTRDGESTGGTKGGSSSGSTKGSTGGGGTRGGSTSKPK